MDAKKIEEVPFEEVYEVEKYGTYYSENKFWQKVQRVAKKVGATVIRPVFQLYYLLHDKDVPLQHKAYIIGALGYFILPFDLIPEGLLPVIGFTDDVAVMGLVLKIVKDSIVQHGFDFSIRHSHRHRYLFQGIDLSRAHIPDLRSYG